MAENDVDVNQQGTDLENMAQRFAAEFISTNNLNRLEKTGINILTEFTKFAVVLFLKLGTPIAQGIAEGFIKAEDENGEQFRRLSATAVKDLLGVDVNLSRRGGGRGPGGASNNAALGDAILRALGGQHVGPIEPSSVPAMNYLGAVTSYTIEGWHEGWMFEFLTSLVPGIGHVQTFADLDDQLAQALGFGRISRSVVRPFIDATVVEPFRRKINITYRPELMNAPLLAREIARERVDRQRAFDILAWQGYSDAHIEALLNENRKTLSVSDVLYMVREGGADKGWAENELKNFGYDKDARTALFVLEDTKRYRSIQEQIAATARDAYIDRQLDRADLLSVLSATYQDERERELFLQLTELKAAARRRRLSEGDARDAFKRGIWTMVDLRRYWRDEGFDEDSIITKELLLRDTLRGEEAAATEKRILEEKRAAAAELKRLDDLARRDALERRQQAIGPGIGDIKRAVIQGFVSIARYETALRGTGVLESDIAFLLEQLQADRDAFLEAEAKRRAAAPIAEKRQLSLSDLDRAFIGNLISRQEYDARLRQAGFDNDDVGILGELAEMKRQDAAAAAKLHDQVEREQASKEISLSQADDAVEHGIWNFTQYTDYLTAAGYNAGAAATLAQLLRAKMDDRAAAASRRDAIAGELEQKGVSLATLETAVLRGIRSIDDYAEFLSEQNYSATDGQLLVDLLADKLADVDAAREERDAAASALADRPLTLAQVERGVILGTLTLDSYRAYLEENGYAPSAIDVLVENLTREIQNRRQDERAAAAIADVVTSKGFDFIGLSEQLRAGTVSELEARAQLLQTGIPADDVDLALGVVIALRDSDADMAAREVTIDGELAARTISLAQFQEAVAAGARTYDDYGAFLFEQGYSIVDVLLLTALLARRLSEQAAKAATKEQE